MRRNSYRFAAAFGLVLTFALFIFTPQAGAMPQNDPTRGGEVPYDWVYPLTGQKLKDLCSLKGVLIPNAIAVNGTYAGSNYQTFDVSTNTVNLSFYNGVYICSQDDIGYDEFGRPKFAANDAPQHARVQYLSPGNDGINVYADPQHRVPRFTVGYTSLTSTDNTVGGDGGNWVLAGYTTAQLSEGDNQFCYTLSGWVSAKRYEFWGLGYCVNVRYTVPKPVVTLSASCFDGLSGSAYDPVEPGKALSVDIYADGQNGPPVVRGVPTNGRNFGVSMEDYMNRDGANIDFRDGRAHNFYAYVSNGGRSSWTGPVNMTGCGKFVLNPQAAGGLNPTKENPSTYSGKNIVSPDYPGWNSAVWSKPAVGGSYLNRFSKNGAPISVSPSYSASYAGDSYNYREYPFSYNLNSVAPGDKYCTTISVRPAEGLVDTAGNVRVTKPEASDTNCTSAVNSPIFKVFRSGIVSGGNFADKNPGCSDTGTLASWFNTRGGQSGNGYGSSAQFSAYALALIIGVASGQPPGGGPKPPPAWSTFANTAAVTSGIDSPRLGGVFGGTRCLYDVALSGGAPILGVPVGSNKKQVSIAASPGGLFNSSQPLVLSGGDILAGKQLTYNVRGDVYIDGDIRFSQSAVPGWSYYSQLNKNIPSLMVYATGNIYVSSNVTQLDGIYIAKNRIITCAEPLGTSYDFKAVSSGSVYSACNKQLTIHGVFVAKTVNLMRSLGSLRNDAGNTRTGSSCGNNGQNNFSGFENGNQNGNGCASGCSNAANGQALKTCTAEIFDFSPELYLSTPAIGNKNQGPPKYDAITSLPPIL